MVQTITLTIEAESLMGDTEACNIEAHGLARALREFLSERGYHNLNITGVYTHGEVKDRSFHVRKETSPQPPLMRSW